MTPRRRCAAAAAALTGEIQQVPPGVSAIKVGGKRAYRLAREGAAPELAARPVTVSGSTSLGPAAPTRRGLLDVDVDVTCSSGTYIRASPATWARRWASAGHLTALRRTRVGPYQVGDGARRWTSWPQRLRVIPLAEAAGGGLRPPRPDR